MNLRSTFDTIFVIEHRLTHAMSDKRRSFIRSLSSAGSSSAVVEPEPADRPSASSQASKLAVSQQESSQPSKPLVESSRKQFFASLRAGESVVTHEPDTEENQPCPEIDTSESVQFTLEGLLAFRNTADGIQRTKTAAEARQPPSKRPNYNSSKRKLLAKVVERQKFLHSEDANTSFGISFVWSV